MKKVAVFGNAGGGKSTLSKRLSEITDLPLYIDQILATDRWIIDRKHPGYPPRDSSVEK
ncbi:hypothetical protein QUA56_25910 [Microcoleus sp. N3A4]|uniref:hypothetical protein n=1 Tax=Microcoleus sp. N3A4 TaxID=3055379 RepID=UPI002FD2934B